jgi:hypothetical protein
VTARPNSIGSQVSPGGRGRLTADEIDRIRAYRSGPRPMAFGTIAKLLNRPEATVRAAAPANEPRREVPEPEPAPAPIPASDAAQRARNIAATVMIETARIEGSLRVIMDVAGFNGAKAATDAALRRVTRAGSLGQGWIA